MNDQNRACPECGLSFWQWRARAQAAEAALRPFADAAGKLTLLGSDVAVSAQTAMPSRFFFAAADVINAVPDEHPGEGR